MTVYYVDTETKLQEAGGPAFPVSIPGCGDNGWHGITMRDYFAAQALPAVIALCSQHERLKEENMAQMFSRKAYEAADAMLKFRQTIG